MVIPISLCGQAHAAPPFGHIDLRQRRPGSPCTHWFKVAPGFLAVSSGFGPAWRLDGGKIVSLTA